MVACAGDQVMGALSVAHLQRVVCSRAGEHS